MNDVIAVILGGGAGTRLFPLTLHRAKPAVPLAGKYRLIDVPVSNCINSGINRIFVLTQYNSATLNDHIARTYKFDRFRSGFVTVLAAEQTPASNEWYQGTADAVRQSRPHINAFGHRHVLVLSGDQLYLMNYGEMLAFHESHGADVTLATIPVPALDAPAYGILKTDESNRVTEFHEKPPFDELEGMNSPVSDEMNRSGRIYLASMGIYIFERKGLEDLLDDCPDEHDFGRQIIPRAIQSLKVVSYPFTGYWSDIGTIRSYYDVHMALARPGPEFNLYSPTMPLYTRARMLPPAKIQSSYVQDSMIGEGSIVINSHIAGSVIGLRAFIGYNTTIKNSIIVGSSFFPWHDASQYGHTGHPEWPGIGEETYIEGAIIDRNVSIGARCILSNRENLVEADGDGWFIRDKLIVITENTTIPDGTII